MWFKVQGGGGPNNVPLGLDCLPFLQTPERAWWECIVWFILAAVVVSDPLDTWPFAYLSMNFGTAQTLIFRARFA
jgi:hypothetical protein